MAPNQVDAPATPAGDVAAFRRTAVRPVRPPHRPVGPRRRRPYTRRGHRSPPRARADQRRVHPAEIEGLVTTEAVCADPADLSSLQRELAARACTLLHRDTDEDVSGGPDGAAG
jgi:hypothetical protein